MAKQVFNKPPLTQQQIVDLLARRGLPLDQPDALARAHRALATIGYFRLSGYMLPYQRGGGTPRRHEFHRNATIDKILDLYDFDTALRAHIGIALEPIEVAFRTSICDTLSRQSRNAHWINDEANFAPDKQLSHYETFAKAADYDLVNRRPMEKIGSHEFITQYYSRYHTPAIPPGWMTRECVTFTSWSRLFGDLLPKDQRLVCENWRFPDQTSIDHSVFSGWIRSLGGLRNRCAHHSRITNHKFTFSPRTTKNESVSFLFTKNTNDLRTIIVIITILMKHIAPNNRWLEGLKSIMVMYEPTVFVASATGFADDYKADPLWAL